MSKHLNDRYCSVTVWIFADICKGMHGLIFVDICK